MYPQVIQYLVAANHQYSRLDLNPILSSFEVILDYYQEDYREFKKLNTPLLEGASFQTQSVYLPGIACLKEQNINNIFLAFYSIVKYD